MFSAKRLHINYTTYDVCRDRDTVSASRFGSVMAKAPPSLCKPGDDPYWYAQILGVFCTVAAVLPTPRSTLKTKPAKSMEFLWVRWYGAVPETRWGFRHAALPQVGFMPDTDDERFAFGFLDPEVVIRACHLIPAFHAGKTSDLLVSPVPSLARLPGEAEDWVHYYYVNM
jgi:hypothetical protein